MPKRLTVRVPEPMDVNIDIEPTVFNVHATYGEHVETVQVHIGHMALWHVEGYEERFGGRDEATEVAVARACRNIIEKVTYAKVRDLL